MQRYILTEYGNASDETRKVYDDYLQATGAANIPVWLKSLGHSSNLARAYWERAKGTLFSGVLPQALKEIIVFVVSAKNGAHYCAACHADCVLNLDKTLRFEDLDGFLRGDAGFNFPDYYREVVDFAMKIQVNPNALEDEDFEQLMDMGFGKEEIYEIIAVIDMTMMFNTYTSALRLDLDANHRAVL
jgi:uncharacterized peroxidase-related enzyme